VAIPRQKHFQRYRQIAGILADQGFDVLLEQVGLTRFVSLRHRRASHRRPEPGTPFPQRIRVALEQLGPTFVKIGQLLSTRPDLIPPDWVAELSKLQDTVEPFPFEEVRAQVREGLGGEIEELFATFEPEPLAAASIGQVHAATLHDGARVVVKVQRPGIARQIDVDLDILRTQAQFAERHTSWARQYHLTANADEISRILRRELDYVAEGRNADKFAERYADRTEAVIPHVHWEYTSRTVLTMERLEGIKLDRVDELLAAGYDPHDIAQLGVRIYLEQVFVDGFFHADPHPGNLFVLPGGRIGFSDFGRVGSISDRVRKQFGDLLTALMQRDEADVVDVLLDIGVAEPGVDERALERGVARMLSQYYDVTLEEVHLAEVVQRLMQLVWRHHLQVPAEFTLLLTTTATLEGVAQQLDPSFNFVEAVRPFTIELVRRRYRPAALLLAAWSTIRRFERLAVDFPSELDRVLKRVGEGTFTVDIKPDGLQPLMDQARELVHRITFAMIIGAFVVGFSLILRQAKLNSWFLVGAQIALFMAAGVGVWFFFDIFYAMWQARRSRRRR